MEEAKRHLEEIGFRVTLTLVKPNKKIPPGNYSRQ
ncbi:hypothetical protein HO912_07925 [Streptococcus suis]|nr:hypothetical protein [Streptococcus suis]